MKSTLLQFLLILTFTTTYGQYNLIWSDEFDGPSLDGTKWQNDGGGWGWGNNEWQYYTPGTNLSFDNGMLTIEAREEQVAGNSYTSGKIITKGLFDIQYGKIEARLQFPMGQGLWPAFWMLGSNIDQVSWPMCGEIDIMEHINNEWTVHGTGHWDNFGHVYYGNSVNMYPGDFHVYSIEWDENSIKWFIDGQQFNEMNIANGINGTSEFHEPFYIILNLAVGGDWPGYPDDCTVFPAQMQVDYVRVYSTDVPSASMEIEQAEFNMFPNPAKNRLHITCEDCSKKSISIHDLLGQALLGDTIAQAVGPDHVLLDTSSLPPGVYQVQVGDARQSFVRE